MLHRFLPARVFRTGALILIPLGLIALAGCGGGGGSNKKVDVEDWVQDACDLAVDNDEKTTDIFSNLSEVDLADDGARDEVVSALEDAEDEFKNLQDDFGDIGVPDIEGGTEVRDAFREYLEENEQIAKDLVEEVKKLDDGRDFEDDLTDVFDEVDSEPDLRDKLEDINERDVDDLINMIEDDPECSSILFTD